MAGSASITAHPMSALFRRENDALLDLINSLRIIPSERERARLLEELRKATSPLFVSFVNAHALNLGWRDLQFRRSLAEADVALRDGSGMAAGLRALGRQPGLNMNGTDFIPALIRAMAPCRTAIFGSELRYAAAAATQAEKMGVEPVAIRGGFEPDTVYVDLAARTRPKLIVLGMGMPKQERVALMIRDALVEPSIIVAGGAVIDFLAKRFPRAPLLMRRLGIEWLFRVGLEPRRLAGRYFLGNFAFLWRIALLRMEQQRLTRQRAAAHAPTHAPPAQEAPAPQNEAGSSPAGNPRRSTVGAHSTDELDIEWVAGR